MALDIKNWKGEYLKSRAEVKNLKAELAKLRESSNADDLSEIKNEIALLREDINSLTELVKEFFSADHEPDELPPEDEPDDYNMEDDPVFEQVRKILANHLYLEEYEIETWTEINPDDNNFHKAIYDLSEYAGTEISYDDYKHFSDVADIVNYINRYGDATRSSLSTVFENREGIHARPASVFVTTASKFNSKVRIEAKGKRIDATSILMLMSMGLVQGTEITITAYGPDAREAVATLKKLIDDKFGEE